MKCYVIYVTAYRNLRFLLELGQIRVLTRTNRFIPSNYDYNSRTYRAPMYLRTGTKNIRQYSLVLPIRLDIRADFLAIL